MRPVHVVLLVVLLAIVAGGAFLLLSDGSEQRPAPALGSALEDPSSAPHDPASLVDPGAARADRVATNAKPDMPEMGSMVRTADATERFKLAGRVVDPRGNGVPDAQIFAAGPSAFRDMPLDEIDPVQMPWMARSDTRSDSNGAFALDVDAKGLVRIAVRAAGFAPLDVELPISSSTRNVGDLRLDAGAVVAGRIVDHIGRPVAGAVIHRRRTGESPFAFFGGSGAPVGESDANGNFRVDQLAVGPWSLAISHEEHPDKFESGETERAGQVVGGLVIALEEGFTISGTVVGAPAEKRDKVWVRGSLRPTNDGAGEAIVFGPAMFNSVRQAKLGPDGSFTLRGLKRDARYRLTTGQGDLGMGMFRGARSGSVEAKAGDRGVQLVYKPESSLVFQVVDKETGAPLTKLDVAAGYRWPMPLLDEKNRTVRDFPDGRVRFANLTAREGNEYATLRIECAGYSKYENKSISVVEGADTDLGVIALERANVVRVTVLDPSGKPLEGATVRLEEMQSGGGRFEEMTFAIGGDEDELPRSRGNAQRAKSDAAGLAVVNSLPGKRATLTVRHKDFAAYRSETLDLPSSGDLERSVRLTLGGNVVVRVVDAQGRGVPGVSIDHRAPTEGPRFLDLGNRNDVTDAQGEIAFVHLEPGLHGFRVRTEGGPALFGGGGGVRMAVVRREGGGGVDASWVETEVTEGGNAKLDLAAPVRGTLRGWVRESGKPLAGATVRLTRKSGDDEDGLDMSIFGDGPKALSNAEGEFSIESLESGTYTAVVTHPSRSMSWRSDVEIREGENDLRVELVLAVIEGRVTNAEGKPIAGIRIHAERRSPEEGQSVERRVFSFVTEGGDGASFGGSFGGQTSVTTDADGRYKLRGVTPDVDLTVIAEGKDVQRKESEAVRVAPDQVKTGVDLVLEQGASIEVSVRRRNGAPAGGCMVRATLEGDVPDVKHEFVGPEGKTTFRGLKPGVWKLTCEVFGPDGEAAKIPEQKAEAKIGTPGKATFEVP